MPSTYVDYWDVAQVSPRPLEMQLAKIAAHLTSDWMPSLPTSGSGSLIGWPSVLIDTVQVGGEAHLALRAEAARCERQWKGFMSWMLGIAGTRHVLETEHYKWIAPLSAFYPESVQAVGLTEWNVVEFPQSSVTARPNPTNPSRLRADYLALRPNGSTASGPGSRHDWAAVEAKGTKRCLTNLASCPGPWQDQVRNVELEVWNAPLVIPRHLVVATRVNPNAARPQTRRLQIRAWNRSDEPRTTLPASAILEIVAAHLFGLFMKFNLHSTARAIALAVQRWSAQPGSAELEAPGPDERRLWSRAEDETSRSLTISTGHGDFLVTLEGCMLDLGRALRSARSLDDALQSIAVAEKELDHRELELRARETPHQATAFGVTARLES